MLLPSAFPCEGSVLNTQTSRSSRPKLPSFTSYQPFAVPQSGPSAIASSCRTLQAMIGCQPPNKTSVTPVVRTVQINPFEISRSQSQQPRQQLERSRGKNKRRRDDFEEDKENDAMDYEHVEQYSTPKRQRRAPLSMPLGLSAQDFNALEACAEPEDDLMMPSCSSPSRDSDDDSGYGPSPPIVDDSWTVDDDRVLVEIVLEKLKLSKQDWNDCAKILGKNRDSIGRRWTLLVGEGNVGLRRGRRFGRTSLDIRSW